NTVAGASLSLAEQARSLGVSDRYRGFWGKEEVVPDAVLQRAVTAMTGTASAPMPQHLGLPPVYVVREDETAVLRWTSHDDAPARWRLVAEEGGADIAAGELQRSYQEAAIALPQALAIGYYRLTLEGAP